MPTRGLVQESDASAVGSARDGALLDGGRKSAGILIQLARILLTIGTCFFAAVVAAEMWKTYMTEPWTRDGTVRAYVVTIAPEVVGRIVELPIEDNQLVHKGDVLMVIDPTDYKIAVSLAEAAVRHAGATAENAQAEAARRQKRPPMSRSKCRRIARPASLPRFLPWSPALR